MRLPFELGDVRWTAPKESATDCWRLSASCTGPRRTRRGKGIGVLAKDYNDQITETMTRLNQMVEEQQR